MHFDIDAAGTGLPLEARVYLEIRLSAALSHPQVPVFAVQGRVGGVAGDGGADDICCRIRVLLRAGGEILVERQGPHLFTVIDRVAEAAAAALAPAAGDSVV